MNTTKMMRRILCVFVVAAMVITMLPTIVFAEEPRKINVGYSSVFNGFGAGGTITVDGSDPITIENTEESVNQWSTIIPDGKDVTFNLTPPNDTYPVDAADVTLIVIMGDTPVSTSNNSFKIQAADYQNGDIYVTIYWSQQEKDFNEYYPSQTGVFPFWLYNDGLSVNVSEPASGIGFNHEQKMSVTPQNSMVTVELSDTPTNMFFEDWNSDPMVRYDLLENPTVTSDDATMIEYDEAEKTVTFYTNVGILADNVYTQDGWGWGFLYVEKFTDPGPGPGPGPQGPQAQIRNQINDNCGSLVLDQTDPNDIKAYVKYSMPLQYLYFSNIPIDDQGTTFNGYYNEFIEKGFQIDYTWPEQQDYAHRLEIGQFVDSEIHLSKQGLQPLTLHAGSTVRYEGDMTITKFEVAEPIIVTENVDGVAVTDANGKYFRYNYQDKVKFNIEFTLTNQNPDGTVAGVTPYSYQNVTIDEALTKAGTAQRKFLMTDMQDTAHWEAGNTYDAYFALAGVAITGQVQVKDSDKDITYWEEKAAEAVEEIAPGNTAVVKSIVPENAADAAVIFDQAFSKPLDAEYKDEQLAFTFVPDENDNTKGTIFVYRTYEAPKTNSIEPDLITSFANIAVSFVFDQEIAAIVEGYEPSFKTFDYSQTAPPSHYYNNVYLVTDLDMINLFLNGGNGALRNDRKDQIINFSSDFLSTVQYSNLETQLYVSDNQYWVGRFTALSYGCGKLLLIYDDTVYGVVDKVGYILLNIIYIPSDTPKTVDAFKEAAMARVEEYTDNRVTDFEIEPDNHWQSPGQTPVAQMNPNMDLDTVRLCVLLRNALSMAPGENDVTAHTVDSCFRLTYKGNNMALWIVADSDKMQAQEEAFMRTVDIRTQAGVSTATDATIPLDVKIAVVEHTDDDVYDEQMEAIGLEEGVVFDIDLNSEIRAGKISTTVIENGFEVRIPIPEDYADKTLYAYYTAEDGELEVHEVTVEKDGEQYFAVFTTDHFSTYTIGEEPTEPEEETTQPEEEETTKPEEEETTQPEKTTPEDKQEEVKTGDQANMTLWVILMAVAACIISGAVLVVRRRKNNQ